MREVQGIGDIAEKHGQPIADQGITDAAFQVNADDHQGGSQRDHDPNVAVIGQIDRNAPAEHEQPDQHQDFGEPSPAGSLGDQRITQHAEHEGAEPVDQ